MAAIDIRKLTEQPEYDFLRTNEHLHGKIMFLTLGGSHAYGTNIEGSDVDVRGVALNSASDLIGLSNFEQFTNNVTDTVVYGFNKLVGLLVNCNPNVIEMLGCRPEHYMDVSPEGQLLLENRSLFLSQKAVRSFGGYATQQLRRLQNAVARDSLTAEKQIEYVADACRRAMQSFNERYREFPDGSIAIRTAPAPDNEVSGEYEVILDVNLEGYPLRDYRGIMAELTEVVRSYGKLSAAGGGIEGCGTVTGRNHKKDEAHLNKHAMHLVRLYLMALDILERGEIITYRENDLPLLMDIRGGRFMLDDGTYDPEFFKMVDDYDKRLKAAAEKTKLPKSPDMKQVESLVMKINRAVL